MRLPRSWWTRLSRFTAKSGPGLLESVYEVLLAHRLQKRGLVVHRQVPITISWTASHSTEAFRADLIVNGVVLVELKSVEQNHPVHAKQLLTYLRLSEKPVGLLINFGHALLKDGLKRIVNQLPPGQSLSKISASSAPPREP